MLKQQALTSLLRGRMQKSVPEEMIDIPDYKILKKCGEEASEIIIAAKNPNAEELKYEIADFLYHMMVLMAECGLTWEDITRELANRR